MHNKSITTILAGLFLVAIHFPTTAAINNSYQYGQVEVGESLIIPITNNAITLNPAIDAVTPRDPRIKTVIDYAKKNGKGVSVVFCNTENLRYVKKLNEMFTANGVFATPPQLTKSKNMMEFNLVKVYVIENQNKKLDSSEPAKMKKTAIAS
jgi:hypothetical protein